MNERAIGGKMSSRSVSYQPIEFFTQESHDNEYLLWVLDQVGVLRAIFKLAEFSSRTGTETINIDNDTSIELKWDGRDSLEMTSERAVDSSTFNQNYYNSVCLHLADGTVVLATRYQDRVAVRHFRFEESDAWDSMKSVPSNSKELKVVLKPESEREYEVTKDEDGNVVVSHRPKKEEESAPTKKNWRSSPSKSESSSSKDRQQPKPGNDKGKGKM